MIVKDFEIVDHGIEHEQYFQGCGVSHSPFEHHAKFKADGFWPNVCHINERGNTDLLVVGWNGAKIVKSWV